MQLLGYYVNYLPCTHTIVAQFILCMIFWMSAATTQHWNYSGQKSEEKKNTHTHSHNMQFCSWRTWPWNKVKVISPRATNVDREQGYNLAKFERSLFHDVWEKTNVKIFFSYEKIRHLSPLNAYETKRKKKCYIHNLLYVLKSPAKFQLSRIKT